MKSTVLRRLAPVIVSGLLALAGYLMMETLRAEPAGQHLGVDGVDPDQAHEAVVAAELDAGREVIVIYRLASELWRAAVVVPEDVGRYGYGMTPAEALRNAWMMEAEVTR